MNRKGAIELTANFIVVIVISSIILVGGLALFYNLRDDLTDFTGAIDSQTEARVKSMMLSNGDRVAVYPGELKLSPGDGEAVGLGITNIYPSEKIFDIIVTVRYYSSSDANPVDMTPSIFYNMLQPQQVTIPPGTQVVKSILLKIPRGEAAGEYVYTIKVVDTAASTESYGTVQVYVDV